IVIDDQRVPLVVAEVFAHGARCIGRDVLHRRGLGSGGGHDDGVLHRAIVFESLHYLCDGRTLLPDRVVDADQVVALAVDDGVERDGGLAGLAVANDQFALAAANRDHAVDGLQPGRHRLANWLAVDYARSNALQCDELVGGDRSFVVDGLAERVDHAADHGVAHRHAHDVPGALDLVAFLDFGVLAEQHHAYLVFLQVHGETGYAVRELQQLAGHNLVESINARDAIAQRDDRARLVDGDLGFVILDLRADQLRDFVCFDLCHKSAFSL